MKWLDERIADIRNAPTLDEADAALAQVQRACARREATIADYNVAHEVWRLLWGAKWSERMARLPDVSGSRYGSNWTGD